jgi:RHS repeat-associated protein
MIKIIYLDFPIIQLKTNVYCPVKQTYYYPFGLMQQGISSKTAGKIENKRKYNGIEYESTFDINLGETFYRSHDPQLGRWWQIDPKPNEMFSPYAAMNNNPLLLSDPMGDTTWVYNTNGVFCGVVNDKLKNQVHYIKTDADPGQPFDGSKFSAEDANAMGKQFRSVSVAFIGSKTISDMRSIVNKSVAAKVEVGFVGVVGNDKEIRLKALPIDGSNHINSVDVRSQINGNYTSDEQKALFLEGHTHIADYVNKMKVGDGSPMAWQKGTGTPSKPDDYAPTLDRGTQKGVPGNAPSMVTTPYGVTLYGTGAMTPYGQPSPNNTYLLYKSLK